MLQVIEDSTLGKTFPKLVALQLTIDKVSPINHCNDRQHPLKGKMSSIVMLAGAE